MGGTDIGRGVQQLDDRFADLEGTIRAVRASFVVGLVGGLVAATGRLVELGTEVRRTRLAFDIMAGGADLADARVRAIVAASGNAVTSLEAMRIAAQASSLGLATTSAELTELARAGRATTLVSPVINDIGTALTELGLASANLSFRRLDQLGLTSTEVKQRMAELQRETRGLDDSQAFLAASVEILNEKYADLLDQPDLAASGFQRLNIAIRENIAQHAEQTGWVDRVAGALANHVTRVAEYNRAIELTRRDLNELTPAQREVVGQLRDLRNATGSFNFVSREQRDLLDDLIDRWHELAEAQTEAARTLPAGVAALRAYQAFVAGTGPPAAFDVPPSGGMNVEQSDTRIGDINVERRQLLGDVEDATQGLLDDLRDSEEEAARNRLDTIRNYQQDRLSLLQDHQRDLTREEEDFARNRLRQDQELQRQLADIGTDRAEREAEDRAKTDERVADLRAEHLERLENLERGHRDNLLNAASRLDARAVAEEQRRFARQREELEEGLEKRLRDEQDNLQERTETGRQADAERIRDLQESFDRQRRLEDEDRAIRLERQQEDFQDQLDDMDAAHRDRLQRIGEALGRERESLRENYRDRLEDLGVYKNAWLELQAQRQADSLGLVGNYWDGVDRIVAERAALAGGSTLPIGSPQRFPSFADPTPTQPGVVVGQGGIRSVTIAEGAIVVQDATDPVETGRIVRQELEQLLELMGR